MALESYCRPFRRREQARAGRNPYVRRNSSWPTVSNSCTAARTASRDGPDLILSGSSTLTSTLLEHGLADEVLLIVSPVLLGTGKRFFADGTQARAFALVSKNAFPSGVILSHYTSPGL